MPAAGSGPARMARRSMTCCGAWRWDICNVDIAVFSSNGDGAAQSGPERVVVQVPVHCNGQSARQLPMLWHSQICGVVENGATGADRMNSAIRGANFYSGGEAQPLRKRIGAGKMETHPMDTLAKTRNARDWTVTGAVEEDGDGRNGEVVKGVRMMGD